MMTPDETAGTEAIEWESTISVRVDKALYDAVARGTAVASDVILIFSNGCRLSSRHVQRKVVTEKKHVLGYWKDRFYPIRRTRATEELADIDPTLSVQKAVHRVIVYADEDGRPQCKIRLAYNKEEVEDGVRYTLTGEAEYSHTSTYDQIVKHERRLMEALSTRVGGHVTPDKLTLGEIFSCVVPKVQIWNCFNPQERYLWAYKWNGIKAKFMCVNGHAYIWPDAGEIYTQPYHGDLSFMECMCLQVELMEDRIVIVEVIAAAYYGKIHTAEPLTNVAVLRHLGDVLTESAAVTVGDKPLTLQAFYNTRLPEQFDRTNYDGLIIVQQDLTIKWKAPTVDVKCIGPYEYIVGSDNQTTVIKLPEPRVGADEDAANVVGVKGRIYEMSSNFKILRQRVDRRTCSTTKEYEAFLRSIKLITL